MAGELFSKKDTVLPPSKTRILTDRQLLAINRDKVIKYFCSEWEKKYGLRYVKPNQSFMSVEKPISDALAQGYTLDMLCRGVDAYLTDDYAGYLENSHPMRLFTKDITRWVMQAKKKGHIVVQTQSQTDDIRALNNKYGIVLKGNQYITEDGKVFFDRDLAIKYAEGKK